MDFRRARRAQRVQLTRLSLMRADALQTREVRARRELWKRSLSGRANGTIDPWQVNALETGFY